MTQLPSRRLTAWLTLICPLVIVILSCALPLCSDGLKLDHIPPYSVPAPNRHSAMGLPSDPQNNWANFQKIPRLLCVCRLMGRNEVNMTQKITSRAYCKCKDGSIGPNALNGVEIGEQKIPVTPTAADFSTFPQWMTIALSLAAVVLIGVSAIVFMTLRSQRRRSNRAVFASSSRPSSLSSRSRSSSRGK